MKIKVLAIFIILIFLSGAKNNTIFEKIKIDGDVNHVKPVLISINKKKDLNPFPEDHNFIMWKTGYRGFHIKDKDTGKEGYIVCGGGNTDLNNAFIVDREKKIILLDVYEHGMDEGQSYYILYDADNMTEIKTIYVPSSFIFPFYGKLLVCEFIKGKNNLSWYITDLYFENKEENGLTKILTEKQILFYNKRNLENYHSDCVNINYENRFLIGNIEEKGYPDVFVFLKWDSNFNVIKYSPIFKSRYGDSQYIDDVQVCKNGKWLKWTEHTPIESNYSKIVFHKISDEYEEGISPPVYAGTYNEEISGDFFNHKIFGVVYGLYDPDFDENIILYKFTDFEKTLNKKISSLESSESNIIEKEKSINFEEEDYYKISDDGKKIISLNKEKEIIRIYRINDLENFDLTGNNYKIKEKYFKFTASDDIKYIAATDWENEIFILKNNEDKKIVESVTNWNGGKDKISYLCFSKDNKYLAGGTVNNSVIIWDMNGKIFCEINNLSSFVNKICFSYDNNIIAFSTDDETAYFYDINGNKLAQVLLYYDQTIHKFSPSGNYFVCGELKDKSIKKIKLNDKIVTLIFSGTDNVAFSPDETHYAINFEKYGVSLKTIEGFSMNSIYEYPWLVTEKNWNDTIKKWFKNAGYISTNFCHSGKINSIAISPDGKHFATGSDDNYIKLFNPDLNLIKTFKKNINGISKIVFSNDGKYIAGCGYDGTINIYDLNGNKLKMLSGFITPVSDIVFNSLNENIIAWNENELIIFNTEGDIVKSFNDNKNNDKKISYIFGALKNNMLLFYIKENENNKYVCIMDMNGRITHKIESNFWGYLHHIGEDKFAVSSRGISNIENVKIFDYKGQFLKKIEGYRYEDDPVVSSKNGNLIAIAFSREYKIKIYNRNFKLINEFYNFEDVNTMVFSNDEKKILLGCDNGIKIISIDQYKELPDYSFKIDFENNDMDIILKVPDEFDKQLKFSNLSYDGKYTVIGDNNTILIMESKTFREIKRFNTQFSISSINISNDNKYIVFVDDEKIIKVIDFDTGIELFNLIGHSRDISDVIISSDNKYIISAGEDNTVIVWDFTEKKEIKRFVSEDPKKLTISKNNTYLSCNSDGYTVVWNLLTDKLIMRISGYYKAAISSDEKYFVCHNYSYDYDDFNKIDIIDLSDEYDESMKPEGNEKQKIIDTGEWTPFHIEITSDNKKIISWLSKGYEKNKICVWNLNSLKLLFEIEISDEEIKSFSIASNNTFLTGIESVKRFDINTGSLLNEMKPLQNTVESIDFSYNGKYLITGHRWGVFIYWDLEKKIIMKKIYPSGSIPYSLLLSHDGKYAVCNGNVNTVKEVWSIDKTKKINTIYKYTDLLDFSPDNRYLLTLGTDEYFTIIDLQTNKIEKLLPGKLGEEVKYASVSEDGKSMISIYNNGPVILWDFNKKEKLEKINKTIVYSDGFAVTKNQRKVYLTSGKALYLYDFDKITETLVFEENNLSDNIKSIYLSKDEKYILLITSRNIYIYDIEKNKIKFVINNKGKYGNIKGAIMNDDNTQIISVHSKGYIYYWDFKKYGIKL